MNDKEKTAEILKRITILEKQKNNINISELRVGTGFFAVAERRIDFFSISPNAGNLTTAYEIKASRGDFLKDLKNEIKQRGARIYSNKFYYAAPKGLIKIEEIPVWAGLIEFDLSQIVIETRYCTNVYYSNPVPAPILNKENPSWGLIASILRNIQSKGGIK